MRNIFNMPSRIILVAGFCFPVCTMADLSAKAVLDKAYPTYDAKHQCWLAEDDENGQRYCMKIDRTDNITADTGSRLYILMAGEAVDDKGEPNGSHATPGLIGAFVVEEHDGKPELLASNAKIPLGANGFAPTQWKFVKLGPSDYWGWQNESGDCHQGYCGSGYSILASYGKTIRDLTSFAASFDDSGACTDTEKRCEANSTSIESKLEIDASQSSEKVFQLRITVSGELHGKELTPQTWTLPFDPKQWQYTEPKDWPLKGAEF